MKTLFTGILKLTLDEDSIEKLNQLQEKITDQNPEYQSLPNDKLHVTLVHQSIFKGINSSGESLGKALSKLIKEGKLPAPTFDITIGDEVKFADQNGKQSYYVEITNQKALTEYINRIMGLIGGNMNPEPQRVFHISLCNKTGSPFDSVAKVWEGKFIKNYDKFNS